MYEDNVNVIDFIFKEDSFESMSRANFVQKRIIERHDRWRSFRVSKGMLLVRIFEWILKFKSNLVLLVLSF